MNKICVSILLSVWACAAQETRMLRGEIRSESPTDFSWLTVRLDPPGTQDHSQTAMVNFGGNFEFLRIPEGLYTLRVLDTEGNEILSQPLTVGSSNTPITLQLPGVRKARPTGETTSVARLRHTPNRQALQAARKAQKFSESGAYERSAAEWRKAVDADPEFSQAHGNLGAQLVRLKRPGDAVEEFRRAIALDPATAGHQANLAIALAQLGRFDEAEPWARHAVRMDGGSALGHYVLGCVLTSRPMRIAEAIQHLQVAAREIPGAHRTLARIYSWQGKPELAMAEMRQLEQSNHPGEGRQ